jgi:5-methylthioadenosine/S-adenosylhomocysteine deaminase
LKDQITLRDGSPLNAKEFLIAHATVIPGPHLPATDDSAVLVRDGLIADIGAAVELKSRHKNLPVVDGSGFIMMPGLFNTHTHVPMGFFRGLGHGKENMIESFLFPAESALTPEILEPLSYSYIYDGLRSGVTSFADHYYFSEGIARAFERFGVRGWVGETVADMGGAFPGEDSWKRAVSLMESGQYSSLIRHVVAPHAADTVSPGLLKRCADYARSNHLPLHMHLSQTKGERDRVLKRDGVSPVECARRAGALSANSLVVHLTSADRDDLSTIRDAGATIGYCPGSTVIYDRLAPIDTFYELNIPMAIGTDCPASNDSADTLAELKIAALFARDRQIPLEKCSAGALLAMATTNPARVLGAAGELGTLEIGKRADIVFMERTLMIEPAGDVISNIIWSAGSRDVKHVMVDGKWRLWDETPTGISMTDACESYLGAVREIRRRTGLG